MSKAYAWPQCTVADCGHMRTHKTEAKARKYAEAKGKEWTTKEGNAVCVCHAVWTEAPADIAGWNERPRAFFDCDIAVESSRYPAPEPEERGAYQRPEETAPVPEAVAQPFDPRDAEAASW